ncbi:hypothetical protein EMCRGX_G020673 [Ephydatia muelleri]
MDLAQGKGRLTTLPIDENGFTLHKGAFRDALRYGWQPSNLSSTCTCGKSFTVEHALSCPLGGFPSIRHIEIRDLTANLMAEVCHNVSIEPTLQPITGETFSALSANTEDGARSDIAADGFRVFWGRRFERTFLDVRVFNPYAPSNHSPVATENMKTLKKDNTSFESVSASEEHDQIKDMQYTSLPPSIELTVSESMIPLSL